MTSPAPVDPAATQQRVLRRYKAFATLVLLAACAVWALTHLIPLPPAVLGYVRASAEAGMVGGLADWFAVTALFRHPLGLPIPHTNLIARNQVRIADGVARYIDNEFLRRETLVEQLRKFDVAERLGALLDDAENRERLVEGLMRFLPRLMASQGEAGIREAIITAAREGLARSDLRPAIARLLRGITESDDLPILVKDACDELSRLVAAKRCLILERVSEKTWWFVPRRIDERLTDQILGAALEQLENLKDPDSVAGRGLRQWLRSLPGLVERSEGVGQRLVELAKQAAGDREAANIARQLWADLRDVMLDDLKAPQSRTRAVLEAAVASLADQVDSRALRRKINAAVEALLAENVPVWRETIRRFIADTLNRQKPREFSRRLELQVGRDLQFVRINGTVIGACAGAAIYFANSQLMP
jgi:uncharacterized membrane-anchored protein YjiN (DUF445 family)